MGQRGKQAWFLPLEALNAMWTSCLLLLVLCLRGALLLAVIPALRSCISSGLGRPTRSQQREAPSESFPHFLVGKCLFPGKFRSSLCFVELNEDPWQKQRVKSYFNFVSLHHRETGFIWIYENTHARACTHTHTHTHGHARFCLEKRDLK